MRLRGTSCRIEEEPWNGRLGDPSSRRRGGSRSELSPERVVARPGSLVVGLGERCVSLEMLEMVKAWIPALIVFSLIGCASGLRYDVGELDLAALAKEQELFRDIFLSHMQRAVDVYYPIQVANAQLCLGSGEMTFEEGVYLENSDMYQEGLQRELANHRGIDERPSIMLVITNSPADSAGFMVGDKILEIDGVQVSDPKEVVRMSRARYTTDEVSYLINRGGSELTINVRPAQVCSSFVRVISSGERNAFADGDNIFITTGMLESNLSDRELAFVLAHELGHNIADHVETNENNAWLGTLFDVAVTVATGQYSTIGARTAQSTTVRHSQDFEREADYLSMYYLERTGIDTEGIEDFWRKMSSDVDYISIQPDRNRSHPSYPERIVRMQMTREEIRAKMENGERLVPNMRRR